MRRGRILLIPLTAVAVMAMLLLLEGDTVRDVDGATKRRTSGMRVLRAPGSRSDFLDALVGETRLYVREAGELRVNGRPLGTSLLLDLGSPRRNVRAIVPAYVPTASSPSGYRAQVVRLEAPVLRDLLVDIDLGRRRVLAVEPGPRSQTKVWAPSFAPTPAGAADED